jgi:hypothetical protein
MIAAAVTIGPAIFARLALGGAGAPAHAAAGLSDAAVCGAAGLRSPGRGGSCTAGLRCAGTACARTRLSKCRTYG